MQRLTFDSAQTSLHRARLLNLTFHFLASLPKSPIPLHPHFLGEPFTPLPTPTEFRGARNPSQHTEHIRLGCAVRSHKPTSGILCSTPLLCTGQQFTIGNPSCTTIHHYFIRDRERAPGSRSPASRYIWTHRRLGRIFQASARPISVHSFQPFSKRAEIEKKGVKLSETKNPCLSKVFDFFGI